MSKFIKLTAHKCGEDVYVNMDHVLQMWEDMEIFRLGNLPESEPEELHFTELVYTNIDTPEEDPLIYNKVMESIKEILELIENANP